MLHLALEPQQFGWRAPHDRYCSGALLITTQLFRAVNGYSNGDNPDKPCNLREHVCIGCLTRMPGTQLLLFYWPSQPQQCRLAQPYAGGMQLLAWRMASYILLLSS